MKALGYGGLILALTLLSQLGGVAWAGALFFRRRLLAFLALYAALSLSALWVAPAFGRVPLSCTKAGPVQMQSWIYCILNRHYADPDVKDMLSDLGAALETKFPGTPTLVLDASFPFFDGFPMVPHLSHDDGRKVDLAFPYADESGTYLSGKTRSPIGYFAFEDGPSPCADTPSALRWNFAALQPLWPDWSIEPDRLRFTLDWLARDGRVEKIFIEPHLRRQLGVSGERLRFQGCQAARHDDHIHLQI